MKVFAYILLGLVLIALVGGCTAAVASAEQVDPGEVRVVLRFGEPTGEVLHPGLSWINPIQEDTVSVSVQPHTYETSEFPDDSKADFTDHRTDGRTTNGQAVDISYSVVFRVPKNNDDAAICFIEDYDGRMETIVERVVKPQSRSGSRLHVQSYTAEDLFGGTKVFDYQDDVYDELDDKFLALGCGLVLDDFLVRGIDFDQDYVDTIEAQQIEEEKIKTEEFKAQQAVYTAQQTAALEKGRAEAAVIAAEGQAKAVQLAADADAYAVEARANADANAITVKAEAQAEANKLLGRSLDAQLLQYQFILNMDAVDWGFLPAEGVLPLLPLDLPGQ